MSSPRRFMQVFDHHFGWDKRHERGQWVTRPTFSLPAVRATVRFAQEFCPTILTCGGDQWTFGPISHWHKGKPILDEGFRLKDELEISDELFFSPMDEILGKNSEKKLHLGNHEAWILDHVASNPGLEGMIEPENYLKLRQRGYKIYSQGEISNIGKLFTVHGDIVFKNGGGANPAYKLVDYYRRNIRAGHIHTFATALHRSPIDAKEVHSGVIVPGLSTRNFGYNKSAPNNHVQGFEWGYSYPNGDFLSYVAIIMNGKVTYNGKLIDGNKK